MQAVSLWNIKQTNKMPRYVYEILHEHATIKTFELLRTEHLGACLLIFFKYIHLDLLRQHFTYNVHVKEMMM